MRQFLFGGLVAVTVVSLLPNQGKASWLGEAWYRYLNPTSSYGPMDDFYYTQGYVYYDPYSYGFAPNYGYAIGPVGTGPSIPGYHAYPPSSHYVMPYRPFGYGYSWHPYPPWFGKPQGRGTKPAPSSR